MKPIAPMPMPNSSAEVGSGTAAEKLPEMFEVKLPIELSTMDKAGVRFVNESEMLRGTFSVEITSEVKVTSVAPPPVLAVRVAPVPAPKTVSSKVPER